jgi:transketolase
MNSLDNKCIDNLKILGVEEINKANSGHPGIVLGSAPILYSLYKYHMNFSVSKYDFINRDRFILSAGHGSALLYALNSLLGYAITNDDLKQFRQFGSKTAGHPERNLKMGIEATTGPLGQGVGMAVGLAIAETHLAAKFNKENLELINHYTYCLVGDGDLQEGVSLESFSLAGHLKLGKLIFLYDSNDIQLDGPVGLASSENIKDKFTSLGFSYHLVSDGTNIDEINKTITLAKNITDQPSIIEIKTIIGNGSLLQGTNAVHGAPLKEEDIVQLKEKLQSDLKEFEVLPEVQEEFSKISKKAHRSYSKWKKVQVEYELNYKEDYDLFLSYFDQQTIDLNLVDELFAKKDDSTRNSFGIALNKLSKIYPNIIGGSADLTSSTKAKGADGDYSATNRLGRNINFGVREHAMGSISNGISLHGGLKAFCSGFFVFSDYLKPAIRLAALMGVPTVFVFSHDSIAVGEDGPTHQPIEQITGLRAIPNLNVMRPADAKETFYSVKWAFESKNVPSVILTTRQNVKYLEETNYQGFLHGAYFIKEVLDSSISIWSSGSELYKAIELYNIFLEEISIISVPSFYLLEKNKKYKLSGNYSKGRTNIGIEMDDATHYYKYVDYLIAIHSFGLSGKYNEVEKHFGFDLDSLVSTVSGQLEANKLSYARIESYIKANYIEDYVPVLVAALKDYLHDRNYSYLKSFKAITQRLLDKYQE